MTRTIALMLVAGVFAALALVIPTVSATDSNQVDFWCDDGMKVEPVSTPYVVPAPPAGTTWTLLVLKAGLDNQTIANPVVGQAYSHSNGKDISHVILCYEEEVPPSTTTTIPTTTTTAPRTTTTTTTEPPLSTTTTTVVITTTSTLPPPTSSTSTTTVPPDPTTTTTEVPPPTYIESGDAGYIGEADDGHEHEDNLGWIAKLLLAVVFAGSVLLAFAIGRATGRDDGRGGDDGGF